ncbi:hypothetical protein Bhyg_15137, partial [Pseudolycoriella hygida]
MEKIRTLYLGPRENAKICRKHFKENDLLYDVDGKFRLKPNAIPCLFLPGPPISDWDHNYYLIDSGKKRRTVRVKLTPEVPNILTVRDVCVVLFFQNIVLIVNLYQSNVGNEIEVGE